MEQPTKYVAIGFIIDLFSELLMSLRNSKINHVSLSVFVMEKKNTIQSQPAASAKRVDTLPKCLHTINAFQTQAIRLAVCSEPQTLNYRS
jgi:hypothetical protein